MASPTGRQLAIHDGVERLIDALQRAAASQPSLSSHCRCFADALHCVRSLFCGIGSRGDGSWSSCADRLAGWVAESEKCLTTGADMDRSVFWDREVIRKLLRLTENLKAAVEGTLPSVDAPGALRFPSASDGNPSLIGSRSLPLRSVSAADCPYFCGLLRDLRTMFACLEEDGRRHSTVSAHSLELCVRSTCLRIGASEATPFLEGCNGSLSKRPCEHNRRTPLDLLDGCGTANLHGVDDPSSHHDRALSECARSQQFSADQCGDDEFGTCVEEGKGDSDLQDMARRIVTLAKTNLEQLHASLDELNAQFSSAAKCLETLYLTGESYPNPSAAGHARELLHHLLKGNFPDYQAKKTSQFSETCSSQFSTAPNDLSRVDEKPNVGISKTPSFDQRSQSHFHENIAEDMKRRLLDTGGPAILGICGESGVGKTHVAQSLACDPEVQEQFLGGIIWLSFGQFPNIHDLQATLWSDTVSKSSFISAEDGLVKLKKKFAEGLPVLLIIDDLWERAHMEAVKILEGKDRGRMLVTSRKREVLEAEDIDVVFMDAMKEDDALALFFSSAGCEDQDKEAFLPIAVDMLQSCCKLPIVVQAIATSLYKERDIQIWQRAQKFLREGSFFEWKNRVTEETVAVLDAELPFTNKEKGLAFFKSEHLQVVEDSHIHIANDITKDTSSEGTESMLQGLAWCFNALTSIHPLFQECFLDLAAYPEGEYVATENLETFWRYGNKMVKDEVFLCLSFLQCRSMVEFKVDSKKSLWNLGQGISWKLPNKFHEFVTKKLLYDWKSYPFAQTQNPIQKRLCDGSNLEVDLKWFGRISKWKNAFYGHTEDKHCSKLSAETLSSEISTLCEPEVLSPSLSCIGNLNCTIEQSNAACQSGSGHSEAMNVTEQHGLIGEKIVTGKEVKEESGQIRLDRFFLPDLKLNQIPVNSVDQFKKADILKLSLIGNDITKVKDGLQFPSLQIALMTNNKKLKRVCPSALHGMQHLLVLDLRGCSSLKELPVTVSSLQSLQLLDLRFCTNLCTLPKSIGYLRHLHQLKLSGCIAFTHLPRSMGQLPSLEVLEMIGCKQLRCLPSTIGHISSLSILNLHGCSSLHALPTSIDSLKRLYFLELGGCSNLEYVLSLFEKLRLLMDLQKLCVMAVPVGIWRMSSIETLGLSSLKNLTFLPSRISVLQQLRNLSLSDCRSLEFLPEELGALSLLQELDLSHTALRKLPQSLGKLEELKHLYVRGCARLLSVPSSISHLSKLELLDLSACWDLVKVPDTFGGPGSFPELRELNMSGCSIKAFPLLSNDAFSKLKVLKLANCSNLCTLPSNFGILHSLEQINLEGCSSLTSLQGVGMSQLKSLTGLNLRNCTQLTLLPATELASLDSLKFLDVSGCSGLSPFPEVLLTRARQHSLKLVRWGALWH